MKENIKWVAIEPYEPSKKEIKLIEKIAINDAPDKYNLENIEQYNLKYVTEEEKTAFRAIDKNLSEKKELFSQYIGETKKHINTLIKTSSIESLINECNIDLKKEEEHFKDSYGNTSVEYINFRKNFAKFQVINKLDRNAEKPKNKVLFFGIIFISLLFESIGNAFFYAQGSDLGLLGGVVQAFMISIPNIILSFVIGSFIFRYMNHIDKIKKTFAWIGAFISFYMLGFLHLASAHYRHLLTTDPENADKLILYSTWTQPFNLEGFESYILIIIGFGISFLIIYEAYKSDDPYPDYGKKAKELDKLTKEYLKIKKEYKQNLDKLVEIFKKNIKNLELNVNEIKEKLNSTVLEFHKYSDIVDQYSKQELEGAKTLSRMYRKTYNDVCRKNNGETVFQNNETIIYQELNIQDIYYMFDETEKYIVDKKEKYFKEVEDIEKKVLKAIDEMKATELKMISDEQIVKISNKQYNEVKNKLDIEDKEMEEYKKLI